MTENGKTRKMKIPEKDGWYEQNELGLPFGKPSNSGNPNARYLWRKNEYSGLASRYGYVWFGGWGRRYVGLGRWVGDYRLGVLGVKAKPGQIAKHKHEWTCIVCGARRRWGTHSR